MGIGETQLEGEKFMGYTINNAIFGENPWDHQYSQPRLSRPRLSRPRLSRPRLSLIGWGWDDYLPWPRHQKHPSECLIVTRPTGFKGFTGSRFTEAMALGSMAVSAGQPPLGAKKTRGFWKK
jgi:hypothetical protein